MDNQAGKTKRTVVVVLLVAICAVCLYVVVTLPGCVAGAGLVSDQSKTTQKPRAGDDAKQATSDSTQTGLFNLTSTEVAGGGVGVGIMFMVLLWMDRNGSRRAKFDCKLLEIIKGNDNDENT